MKLVSIIKEIFNNNLKECDMYDWKGTIRNLNVEYIRSKYIFTWKQAKYVENWDCIVINIPCEFVLSDKDIIEYELRKLLINLEKK